MSILAASSWATPLTRPANVERDASGDASFTRQQAWLREYERAAIADRQAATTSSVSPSTPTTASAFIGGTTLAATKPATPQTLDAEAANLPNAASHASTSGLPAMPDRDQIALSKAAVDTHAASGTPSATTPLATGSTPTMPWAQGIASTDQTDTAALLPSAFEAEPCADAMPPHDPADMSVTVFNGPQSLALTLRDARLLPDRADTLLRELVATGLPSGVRRVTVTVNGRTSELHLPSERT
jgi:hypothetical protein